MTHLASAGHEVFTVSVFLGSGPTPARSPQTTPPVTPGPFGGARFRRRARTPSLQRLAATRALAFQGLRGEPLRASTRLKCQREGERVTPAAAGSALVRTGRCRGEELELTQLRLSAILTQAGPRRRSGWFDYCHAHWGVSRRGEWAFGSQQKAQASGVVSQGCDRSVCKIIRSSVFGLPSDPSVGPIGYPVV